MTALLNRLFLFLGRNFKVKVFLEFSLLVLIISASFTIFFIRHQSQTLSEDLRNKGVVLARLFAHSARLGVFAENESLLRDSTEGMLQQEEVIFVSLYTAEGKLLAKRAKEGITHDDGEGDRRKQMFELLSRTREITSHDSGDIIEFWSPVITRSSFSPESDLFFEESLIPEQERVIGFVCIILDKKRLKNQLNALLFESILIAASFLILGSLLTYLVARRITRPLTSLTEGVKAIERGASVETVSVQTQDEIGNLARAFNSMVESLKKKESEKAQLEDQLRHAQKMEAIGTLAGGIAHDFNNILTTIIGYGSLLAGRMSADDPLKRYVDLILASGSRAANLTQSLLTFSRKQIIDLRPANLNEIIRNIEKFLDRLIGEDIEFEVTRCDDALIVLADTGQIEQVLMNLVTNARDAMPKGGKLSITTYAVRVGVEASDDGGKQRPQAVVTVSDTGVGIDEKIRERIFDPYFTTKEVGKGTGLGLSIVYGIMQQHGGTVDVSSEPGKGTTFRLFFPIIDKDIEEEDHLHQEQASGGTETVLVAEDDEDVRCLTRDVLQKYGYKVVEARDGEDAVSKFLEHAKAIRLLILDVVMPKKNGKEAFEEIRKIRPDIRAIFVSGYAADIIEKKGITEGSMYYLSKPISPDTLLRKIRDVLDA